MAGQILSTQVIISQKADFLSDIQSKASESAAGLVEALTQMTDTARIELDRINGSAWLIQEQLRFQENGNLQWKGWLMSIVAFIYRSAPWHSSMTFDGFMPVSHKVSFSFSRPVLPGRPWPIVLVPAIHICSHRLLECVSSYVFCINGGYFFFHLFLIYLFIPTYRVWHSFFTSSRENSLWRNPWEYCLLHSIRMLQ